MFADADIAAATVATVGTGAVVTADVITVEAKRSLLSGQDRSAVAELVLGAVGILAGAGGAITAKDRGDVRAEVLTGANLDAALGSVTVKATRTSSTDAHAEAGSGGVLAAVAVLVASRVEGTTSAIVNAGVTVTANSLTVDAYADVTATSKQFVLCIAVACAAVSAPNNNDDGSATAAADDTVVARLGGDANATVGPTSPLVNVTALVWVHAGGTRTVDSDSRPAPVAASQPRVWSSKRAPTATPPRSSAAGCASMQVRSWSRPTDRPSPARPAP